MPVAEAKSGVPAAAIAPPLLNHGATIAFRVSDVREGARAFLARMAEILEDATPIEPGDELDASDLRITSEEEALAEALRAAAATPAGGAAGGGASPPAQAPSASERTKTAVSEPASAPGADSPAGGLEQGAAAEDDGVPASALRQAEKLAVQQAHDASVARIRQERVAARAAAAGSLRSLREAAPDAPGGGDAGGRWRRKKTFSSMGFRMKADPAATSENRGRQLQRVAQASAAPAAAAPAVPAGQVVLHVAVHLPQAPAHVSEEWLVLGSQRLTALRDALYCLTEVNVAAVEREEGARCAAAGRPPLRLRAPSAYLYVEGTFYNDMRAPDAVDYSAHIRQYNTEHGVRAPPHPPPGPASPGARPALVTDWSCASMEEARFEDLWLRLGAGAPGLYCHQGGCEHLVVFRDVRPHDPQADPPLEEQYPFKLSTPSVGMVHYRQCEACNTRVARCLTYDDAGAPHSPFFWCHECFTSLHYSSQGSALHTDFKVFPYVHDYQQLVMQAPGAGIKEGGGG